MAKSLVLHNRAGDVVRVFPWTNPQKIWTIFRKDTRRLEVLSSLEKIEKTEIPFHVIDQCDAAALAKGRVDLKNFGYFELADGKSLAPRLETIEATDFGPTRKAILFSIFFYLLIGYMVTDVFAPSQEIAQEITEEKKREIVKVVKRRIAIPKTVSRQTVSLNRAKPQKVTKTKRKGWKRRGALAALGQLNKSKQKGGLDLGAVKATAGPGLGGSQGSGGVQTSIYSKGMVAAPLGAGHNIKGGGGYGTKGKGGGKAGYGSLSLIGATGVSLIPIPEEATVDGGLDESLIADVVRRNLGQIRFCYEQGLQLNSSLSGRVAVNWVIDGGGRVKVANVKNTSLNNKTVEDCILRRLRTWKFPIPEGNQDVPVSYPFLLKRTGRS